MRKASTAAIWTASIAAVLVGGIIAVLFGFMASAVDPSAMLTEGADTTAANMIETWTSAAEAAGAFVGLVIAAALGVRLWHTARFKAVAVALTAAEVAAVSWACVFVYREYW